MPFLMSHKYILVFCLVLAILLSGCGRSTPQPTATPTPTPLISPTPQPSRTPTVPPIASEANPLILGIVSETNDPRATAAAEEMASQLTRITTYTVKVHTYHTTQELVVDLQAGKVHIVFLQPFTYIWAKQKSLVQPALLSNHFGVYLYGAQFMANVNSKFTIFFDPVKGLNTVDPATALKQFDGKRPCWVDPTSASAYIAPLGLLTDKGIKVKDGAFLQSHTAVVRALYITGICDFGLTFSTTGDPRTSTAVSADLTDVMNRIVIIYQLDSIIPNMNVSFHSSLPRDIRNDLAFAIQDMARTDKGRQTLTAATGYEITELKGIDDTVYDPLRSVLRSSGVSLETLIGK
jgi:phosphonate transport system substrate-binding protein